MTRASAAPGALGQQPTAEVLEALRGRGLQLDLGLASLRVRTQEASLARDLQSVYRHFPYQLSSSWTDLHINLARPRSLRRWIKPQVLFSADTEEPFEPFPSDTALPLLEWGTNYLIGRRFNNVLLLHAGVVERDGLALVMPALPGSGKSTLTAALSLRGWRLLSDEFGALDLATRRFQATLKPVALKNNSIEVIRRFSPSAELGPEYPRTRKGRVAHLAPPRLSVDRLHEQPWPGAVVLPRWSEGQATRLTPVPAHLTFSTLAFNAFNYGVLGAAGFQAVAHLANRCPAWQLEYSDLDDAIGHLDRLWPDVVKQAAGHQGAPGAAVPSL